MGFNTGFAFILSLYLAGGGGGDLKSLTNFEYEMYSCPGSTFDFVKNTHQKGANLMFGLILPVLLTPAWFLVGQCTNM